MKTKTIVINLDRREDRLNEFKSNYCWSDYHRFSAFDGKENINELSFWDEKLKENLLKFGGVRERHLPGAFGCWRSHLSVWDELILDDEYDAYLVFEDDVRTTPEFFSELPKILDAIDFSFDIYYIGGRTKEKFTPKRMHEWEKVIINDYEFFKSKKKKITGHEFDRGLFSYIITKNGAKKLVDFLYEDLKNGDFIIAVDEWINKNKQRIDVCDVFPHITWSPAAYKSDIR